MVVADGTLGEQRSVFLHDVILDIHVSVHIEQVFVVQVFTAAFVLVYGGRDVVEVPVVGANDVPDSLDEFLERVESFTVVGDGLFKCGFVERDMFHRYAVFGWNITGYLFYRLDGIGRYFDYAIHLTPIQEFVKFGVHESELGLIKVTGVHGEQDIVPIVQPCPRFGAFGQVDSPVSVMRTEQAVFTDAVVG